MHAATATAALLAGDAGLPTVVWKAKRRPVPYIRVPGRVPLGSLPALRTLHAAAADSAAASVARAPLTAAAALAAAAAELAAAARDGGGGGRRDRTASQRRRGAP